MRHFCADKWGNLFLLDITPGNPPLYKLSQIIFRPRVQEQTVDLVAQYGPAKFSVQREGLGFRCQENFFYLPAKVGRLVL